jgi:dUTP pyrophosphatase
MPEPGEPYAAPTQPQRIRIMLGEGARMPTRATPGSAGLDLYAARYAFGGYGGPIVVDTGVHIEIPHGYAGHVLPRSSLSKRGLHVLHGVIDSDYRGSIGVCLLSQEGFTIEPGQRIAQLVIAPVWCGELEVAEALTDTDRGAGGFGSTGA